MLFFKKKLDMDILDNVYTVLDKTKGLLDLASVPGLSAATDVVLAIIDQVKVRTCTLRLNILTADAEAGSMQKIEANKETVAALSKKLEQLNDIIMKVVEKVERRTAFRQANKDETTKMWEDLQEMDGWKNRVNRLQE